MKNSPIGSSGEKRRITIRGLYRSWVLASLYWMGSTYNRIRTEMLPKTSLPGSAETPREVEGYSFTFQRGGEWHANFYIREKHSSRSISEQSDEHCLFGGEQNLDSTEFSGTRTSCQFWSLHHNTGYGEGQKFSGERTPSFTCNAITPGFASSWSTTFQKIYPTTPCI